MPSQKLDTSLAVEATEAVKRYGTQVEAARMLGISRGALQSRLRAADQYGVAEYVRTVHGRKHFNLDDGYLIVGSDAHFWPGIESTAYRAFMRFCEELRPTAVILNGDVFDGASISRHPMMSFEERPSVVQELKICDERLNAIESAARTKNLFWTIGNHDSRFESFLANNAPAYNGVKGTTLKDHFPMWAPAISLFVNDDLVIKHRWKSGIHAPHNNTLWAGRSIVTGHLHSQKVYPISDYNGTRWGVDCGTLAQPYGPQFVYTEDAPVNWRSGFAIIRYKTGRMLTPTLVRVMDEEGGEIEWGVETFKV